MIKRKSRKVRRRARQHRGDIMSPEKRSALMARIRGRNTGPEQAIAAILLEKGLECERHCPDLPGRPDFVFRASRIAVFIDGDFWHGWRFPAWRHKLSAHWEKKIEGNRRRDIRNFRRLRRSGWRVIRFWEHQIENDVAACLERLLEMFAAHRKSSRRKASL